MESKKDIKKIYESQFYIANTLLYILNVLSKSINLKKKKNLIRKIKDPNNIYIFSEYETDNLIKNIQKGGSIFFLEDLENIIGPKFSIALQMVIETASINIYNNINRMIRV